MSFGLANPSGWVTGDLLTETQINQIDTDHAAAIDGTGGGSYVLSSPLSITGSPVTIGTLNVSGVTTINGTIDINSAVASIGSSNTDVLNISSSTEMFNDVAIGTNSSDVFTINSTSTFVGPTVFSGAVTANGNVTLGDSGADAITTNGTATFNNICSFNADVNIGNASTDTLSVLSESVFLNDLTIGSSSSDSLTIESTSAINAPVSVASTISFTGSGRTRETGVVTTDSDSSYSINSYRNIYIPSSVTATRLYTITGTQADGEWCIIQNDDNNPHDITSALFTGFTLPANSGVKLLRISGSWYTVQRWT